MMKILLLKFHLSHHWVKVTIFLSQLTFNVTYLKINSSGNYKYKYGHGDYQSMTCELLNIDWTTIFNGLDIDIT